MIHTQIWFAITDRSKMKDKLDYHETALPTANLLDTKILLNSTISDADKGA